MGPGIAARFNDPRGVAVDSKGNLYVADTDNHKIRLGTPVLITQPAFGPNSLSRLSNGQFQSRGQSTGPHPGRFRVTGDRLEYPPNRHSLDGTNHLYRPACVQFPSPFLPRRIPGAVKFSIPPHSCSPCPARRSSTPPTSKHSRSVSILNRCSVTNFHEKRRDCTTSRCSNSLPRMGC